MSDDFDIDNLLIDIEKKTDLSQKTKLENGGISYVYTREDINKMKAHYLKDILKSTYPFGYNENYFGISDPYSVRPSIPYMSSNIKIFIDNQEITTGLYGSGLVIYGDIDIDFVDHIEVYSGNPTFEFSTESAFTVIKLYSKIAQKDEGSKVVLGTGSYGTKDISIYNTQQLDNDWSYFAYMNIRDNNRKKYYNNQAVLSRDSEKKHIFGSLYNNQHRILLDIFNSKSDSFIDSSIFATPNNAEINNDYLHLGYDTKKDNLFFLLSVDIHNTDTKFEDLNKTTIMAINAINGMNIPYDIQTKSNTEVYTMGLNYNIKNGSNNILMGAKYRLKHFKYDQLNINRIELPRKGRTKQETSTVFIEDQYSLDDNKLFTADISYSEVRNNNSVQNDGLLTYRLRYTYTNENIISKTIASHLEFSIDPYLVNSIYLSNPNIKTPKTQQNSYMQDIKYNKDNNEYEMILSYNIFKDNLITNMTTGLLEPHNKDIKIKTFLGRYVRHYNSYDKFEITLGTNKMKDIPFYDKITQYASSFKNYNTIGNFDIFNEILYYRDTITKKSSFDYSSAITYHYSDDLSFSLKGTNLLSKANKTNYRRVDPTTMTQDTPLSISPIDKKVMLSLEYTF
jgi:iron complex outermembrane receptor protein